MVLTHANLLANICRPTCSSVGCLSITTWG
ncbi:hypothetical protein [Pseudaminobacter soli (ex Li et al. 2025)]|nr:hypothetical protein [Mesorhizobium soli]